MAEPDAQAEQASDHAINRIARLLAAYATEAAALTHGAARSQLAHRDRDLYAAAVRHAETHGWIITVDAGITPGPNELRRAASEVYAALDVLFAHRHALSIDVLRRIAAIWDDATQESRPRPPQPHWQQQEATR